MSHRTLVERAAAVHRIEQERVRRQLRRQMFKADVAELRLDRFELRRRLGDGATGIVYAAYDPSLAREVAIKLLVVAPVDDHQALAEARTLARFAHPNVLPVFEVGTHEGVPYIVSELVAGGSLRAWLAEAHPPEARREVAIAIGRGLAEAHRHGVVHRDLKPENVLVGADGRARVADFGLARWFDPATHVVEIGPAGTPMYMAPEQRDAGVADPRTDQYAFGLVAHEVCFGHLPGVAPIDARHPLVRLAPILARACAIDPAARWPTMDALVDALAHRPVRRAPWIALGVAVAAAAVLGGVALGRGGADREPALVLSERVQPLIRAQRWDECARLSADEAPDAVSRQVGLQCAQAGSLDAMIYTCDRWREVAAATLPDDCAPELLDARRREQAGDLRGCAERILAQPPSMAGNLVLVRCAARIDDRTLRQAQCVYGLRLGGAPIEPTSCGRAP